MLTKNFQMYKLDVEKVEESEITLSTFVESWRKQGNSRKKKKKICFIDYSQDFDYVVHNTLCKILKKVEAPDLLTCLLRKLCVSQEETVRTGYRTTDWFKIGKRV